MIGILDDSGNKLSITYNGLVLNASTDTDESTTEGLGPDLYVVDAVAPKTGTDYILEPNQQRSGVELFNPRKVAKVYTLRGRILAPSYAKLYDKIEALAAAFDPDTIAWENGNDDMFLPLTFSTPTTDTGTYPTGLMDCVYYAIPATMPEPVIGPTGQSADFRIEMLMRDPRRYLTTQTTRSGSGSVTNAGDFRTWPTFTITMSGAGNDDFTITTTGSVFSSSLVLDLSNLVNGNVVTIDCENSAIIVDDAETPGYWVSGSFPEIEPGNNTITYTNTTHTSSRVIGFYAAFSS